MPLPHPLPRVTPVCGWEIDDVVRWLEGHDGMFDALSGVARKDAFGATLTFEEPAAAERLVGALRSEAVPQPMQAALEDLAVTGRDVRIRFRTVEDVALTERGPDHVAACVLDRTTPGSGRASVRRQ